MTDKLKKAPQLLPCPFCGDEGEKGIQAVTLMNTERTSFKRVSCRCCGATCPEPNWNHRAALAQQDAQAVTLTLGEMLEQSGLRDYHTPSDVAFMVAAQKFAALAMLNAAPRRQRSKTMPLCSSSVSRRWRP